MVPGKTRQWRCVAGVVLFYFLLSSHLLFAAVTAPDRSSKRTTLSSEENRSGSPHVYSVTVLSPVYKIDRIFKSMDGPAAEQKIDLLKDQPPELIWIRAFYTEIVGADGITSMPQDFMCHANITFDAGKHKAIFLGKRNDVNRVMTLSQGQLSARFPEGFGMPVRSDETLTLVTQVLNLNFKDNPDYQVRHKVTVEFIRDRDLKEPLKPLFITSGTGMVSIDGAGARWQIPDEAGMKHGVSCVLAFGAPNAKPNAYPQDAFGHKFTVHWAVPPGKQVYPTNVTKMMNLTYDTTLHYAISHLHPYAESLELRDITTGKSLFKVHAHNFNHGMGLSRVDDFSSKQGIPLFKDHDYELVSVYNNTTSVNQDAMVGMIMFLLDKEYEGPILHSTQTASRS